MNHAISPETDTTSDTPTLYHEIFVLDAYLESPLNPDSMQSSTEALIQDLLSSLCMEKLGPLAVMGAQDLSAPGWSFIQPITTSHISGHYFEKPGKHPHIRMDIYSCKHLDWHSSLDVIHAHLALGEWRATFIEREIEQTSPRAILDIVGKGATVLSESRITMPHAHAPVHRVETLSCL